MGQSEQARSGERGTILLVVVFIAAAIAALATLGSGRVVAESRQQGVFEDESRANNEAFARLHMALNVINNSAYDLENHNLEIRYAMDGVFGGTAGGDPDPAEEWLRDPEGVVHGLIRGTDVRVYHARDYIARIASLKGEMQPPVVDPEGRSDNFFAIEALGRAGDTIRLVSALVRENEPFSSFVFFQNRGTLGISGRPRGLIHANESIDFYFPDGVYVDGVSAVEGFGYQAGATKENTSLRRSNPEARRIDLNAVDFEELKAKADLFVGEDGLDAEILLQNNGDVRIKQFTPPRFEVVTKSRTDKVLVGSHYETVIVQEEIKIGEQEVPYEEQVLDHYEIEEYVTTEQVQVGATAEIRTRTYQVQVGTQDVLRTREDPVYEWQTVTKYKWVKVWQPYETDAGGGTAIGGGGDGELGEYVWVQEPYETEVQVQVGTATVEYTVTEPVYEWVTEEYMVEVPVYETQEVLRTREVPVYTTIAKTRIEDIYEWQDVEQQVLVYDYESVVVTWEETVWVGPKEVSVDFVALDEGGGGMIYIDGRITDLKGDIKGRLTIVGNEKVRVTGNIRYVDAINNTAMLGGLDYTSPYIRNPDYQARDVLGIVARSDIVFTNNMPSKAEVNGTLMSVEGRVGVDGFWADPATGELYPDSWSTRNTYLTPEQVEKERAYDRTGNYATKVFVKDSLRRIGGLISNNRIVETYVSSQNGYSKVTAGFKRGSMKFDISLLFNPPPDFVMVPRPVVVTFTPVFFMRGDGSS